MADGKEQQTHLTGKTASHKNDVLFLFLLIGLAFIFFFTPIVSGRPLFGLDFIYQFHPWKKFIYEHLLSHGFLPFWNPYLFSGMPFIANIQTSMFYPLGFLYYLLPPESAYGYSTALHCVLGSFFMYAFMRALSVSREGSLVSAVVFSFNGFFMGHLYAGHLSFVQNYIWIPLIFHLQYRFIQKQRLKYVFISGLVFGVQLLGGFPQIAFYTALGVLGFGLFHAVCLVKDRRPRLALKLGTGTVLLLMTGFALAAVQLLPTLEFARLSTRGGGISYAFATYESLHPKELLAFLLPDVFGNPIDNTYWRSPETWHFWESCGYVGILPLLLAFVSARHPSLNRLRIFFIIMTLIALFLALGKYNPLYPLVYKLPGFNRFRIPAQIIFLYVFGVSLLAGMGLHQMKQEAWRFNKGFFPFFLLITAVLIIPLAGLLFSPFEFFFQLFKHFAEGPMGHANVDALYGRLSLCINKGVLLLFAAFLLLMMRKGGRLNPKAFGILCCALVITDLYLFGAQFVRTHESTLSPGKKHVLEQLNTSPAQGRVVTLSPLFEPNDGLSYRFPSILGYDPLILRRYVHYIQSSQDYPHDDHVVNLTGITRPRVKLLALLNLDQVVLGKKVNRLDNQSAYARIVPNALTRPAREILSFMEDRDFDPRKEVVLEPEGESRPTFGGDRGEIKGSVTVLDYQNEEIHLKTRSSHPGYLVLSEIFYPGWKAEVDGKRVKILRGNYLFRVIPLEEGIHEVKLHFVSRPFRAGAVVSLLTLSLVLWLVLRPSFSKKGIDGRQKEHEKGQAGNPYAELDG